MHDTESLLENITGSKDYIKELEKLTGNIEHIDNKWFDNVMVKVNEADGNIRKILKDISCSISKDYFKLSIESEINKSYITTTKKSRKSKKTKVKKSINEKLKPKNIIKSPYFKMIKKIEKTCNNLLEAYGDTFEKMQEVIKTNPGIQEIKNFYDYILTKPEDITMIKSIKSNANIIIDQYMTPMYDVKATMDKNWHLIDSLFNKMVTEISITEVKEMLYLFIVAKYRCTITENDKYYMKLFMSIVNKDSNNIIGKMDPARFLELLDTINLDVIDKKQTVYKFANQSKEIIKRIVNKNEGETMEDIMKDISDMMVRTTRKEEEEEEEAIEAEEIVEENNDILKGI